MNQFLSQGLVDLLKAAPPFLQILTAPMSESLISSETSCEPSRCVLAAVEKTLLFGNLYFYLVSMSLFLLVCLQSDVSGYFDSISTGNMFRCGISPFISFGICIKESQNIPTLIFASSWWSKICFGCVTECVVSSCMNTIKMMNTPFCFFEINPGLIHILLEFPSLWSEKASRHCVVENITY